MVNVFFIIFSCKSNYCAANTLLNRLKDGHPLHPCPQMDFVCGPNSTYGLTIEKATPQDMGQYSAIISNKSGEESSSGNVKVTPSDKAPVFQTQLQPVKVVEGYPAKLEVKVDGFPLPKLTWLVLVLMIFFEDDVWWHC